MYCCIHVSRKRSGTAKISSFQIANQIPQSCILCGALGKPVNMLSELISFEECNQHEPMKNYQLACEIQDVY